jgi:hypothetical protein
LFCLRFKHLRRTRPGLTAVFATPRHDHLSRTCPLCKGTCTGLFFVIFFRFQESLGPQQPPKPRKQLSERVLTTEKNKKRTQTRFVTAPRVSVLLRCTVTGCSWLPDLVCCSNERFSTKQPPLCPTIHHNPGPAARYGALGTYRTVPSGLIKSRCTIGW